MINITTLTCCCCGKETKGRQWHNRDKGYGLGDCCIEFVERGTSDVEMKECYGVKGVNYDVNNIEEARNE